MAPIWVSSQRPSATRAPRGAQLAAPESSVQSSCCTQGLEQTPQIHCKPAAQPAPHPARKCVSLPAWGELVAPPHEAMGSTASTAANSERSQSTLRSRFIGLILVLLYQALTDVHQHLRVTFWYRMVSVVV